MIVGKTISENYTSIDCNVKGILIHGDHIIKLEDGDPTWSLWQHYFSSKITYKISRETANLISLIWTGKDEFD